ncbi:MAG: ABC transporter permease [Burkholderia contaminans]|uniref:ABC transporter permease subunit n=2 Tax=Burkholderia contaminans TaxID=488447 RepID=A0AAP4VHV0_9BURK|nr:MULTISPECIES: ABC transporter permease subunit [Burkholderia]MBD1410642.1 ABC transporter permease subunit [Burkholderia contaminans]MBH9669345.1 ABC transporter permease subunit [Burkholderia contaminans]MBH9676329.1 ABC transporter permease subunit [Burkholderia contaminans]MBH9706753.1 ABC transporter permease subunit [Burkholderia contaminans]MBM6425876.1 ABC transporter permease subunit [Burkholderia contaminans]
MEHHAEVLRGGRWTLPVPGWRDLAAMLIVTGLLLLAGISAHQMAGPLAVAHPPVISLSPAALPGYTLRTVSRMFAALLASIVFTFVYATVAARSRSAERVLIPLLDVLQSVPILGYLSFTVLFFLSLFPGRILGAECAAIFAIFTSQAWNMTFSFYQALRTVPLDLDEASRSFRLSAWQRFWRLEVPFAMPGLVWNAMMSMSGGWFFVVASEAIAVGGLHVDLPGVGAYVAQAIANRDLAAVGWAIVAMSIAIVLYDQLLFRPLVAWSERFRYGDAAPAVAPHSWMLDLFHRSRWMARAVAPVGMLLRRAARARLHGAAWPWRDRIALPRHAGDVLWFALCAAGGAYAAYVLFRLGRATLTWTDLRVVAGAGALTFVRVTVLVVIASAIWVPIGIAIGLRPRVAARVQPVTQFLAAFPANLLFPVAVFAIVRFRLEPDIWLCLLMILGAQWYVLFNVIAGASAFPADLCEAAACFRVRPATWWRRVMLPGVLPYFVTGAITASGGAWNASIVAEAVSWGSTRLNAGGLGAYIARMTDAGDYPHIALGVAVMSLLVIATNRLVWRPMYAFAERRTRLD